MEVTGVWGARFGYGWKDGRGMVVKLGEKKGFGGRVGICGVVWIERGMDEGNISAK